MKKVLVIGANGFTGRRVLNDLATSSKYIVSGCSLHPDIDPSLGTSFFQVDIRDQQALQTLFQKREPEVVINTSALSVPDYCETHHEEAYKMNVETVKHIAQLCEQYNARLIHLSSDFVFDGKTNHLYTEEDIPMPVNYYGLTKLQGEQMVASHCSDWAIARVVVVYGRPLHGQHSNIIQLVYQRLSSQQEIQVVSDQYRTPTFVGDVSQGIVRLIEYPANGIFHISGKDYLSIADIAFQVALHLKLDTSLIHPVTTKEMQEKTPRPQYSGLSIEKARKELNYQPHSLEEGIQLMFQK